FTQFIHRGADLERDVMQADRRLATTAAVTRDFHHGKVVVVAEREERHLEAALVEARAERQSEHAAVKALGALAVGHPQHHMPQCLDLHRGAPPLKRLQYAPWNEPRSSETCRFLCLQFRRREWCFDGSRGVG